MNLFREVAFILKITVFWDVMLLDCRQLPFQEETATFINRLMLVTTRVGTLIVATIYLQLIQNRYMFQSFTVLQCSHQHCVQPVVSDVEVIGYL